MPTILPNIPQVSSESRKCNCCGRSLPVSQFARTHSEFYDQYLPLCNKCIAQKIELNEENWEYIDKVCQWAGIPWIVKEWERIKQITLPDETWAAYAKVFSSQEYQSIGWGDYFRQYKRLKEVGLIEEEIPEVRDQRYKDLRRKWGENYTEEELNRLEDLYGSILRSYNVVSGLQEDQAEKLCKISLEVDSRIRAGDKDVDKFMATYDKLVKGAEFTPKNTKNASDFDSIAEIAYWMEKHGRINKFYDDVTRDVIDETLKNIENFNQRLYVNEGGIGEEITDRLRALNLKNDMEKENFYGLQSDFAQDEYANDAWVIDDEEEFDAGGGKTLV